MSGMLVGATIYNAAGEKGTQGAIIGVASAVVSTFLTFYARKFLNKKTRCPGAALGMAEDIPSVKATGYLLHRR